MLTTGATDGERGVTLVFTLETGEYRSQRGHVVIQELCSALAAEYIFFHLWVDPGERTQVGLPERVRQESHVDHQIDVRRGAIFEAETDN